MASRFVSAGGAEVKAPEGLSNTTDQAWEQAKKQVEQARKPHQREGPAPGTQEGGVSLYEHLQAQKLAKQEAFEEASKLRNQFRPLDDAEVQFLEGVREKERNAANDVKRDTAAQLEAFHKERAAAELVAQEQIAKDQETEDYAQSTTEQWTAGKKRRRVAGPDQSTKTAKIAPTPLKEKTTTAQIADNLLRAESSEASAQLQVAAKTTLVGYGSDSEPDD